MMRTIAALFFTAVYSPALADTVVATRAIRAQTILTAQDLAIRPFETVGGYNDPSLLVGLETRLALYPDKPVRQGDVGPAAIVDRNQTVLLVYTSGGLKITTEARALGRGGVGEHLRVLNLGSRMTVAGQIQPDGSVLVE
jgi:flagellar basal body P-ring formation protein FlgA